LDLITDSGYKRNIKADLKLAGDSQPLILPLIYLSTLEEVDAEKAIYPECSFRVVPVFIHLFSFL
jgi:hypothetical protein